MEDLSGKRCLVTGGSRGLGRAMVLAFARAGAKVAFTWHRSSVDAAETLELAGPDAISFQGSVTDQAHADHVVRSLGKAWGGLDVLVNNAGINQVLPVALIEGDDWDAVMGVNAKGTFLFSRAALRPMIRARQGYILNVGSFSDGRVVEAPVHYAASKAAIRGMTEALAREVGRYGIQVNLLSPGLMDAGQSRGLPQHRLDEYCRQNPLGRLLLPEEVAEVALQLIASKDRLMTGARIPVDGGI